MVFRIFGCHRESLFGEFGETFDLYNILQKNFLEKLYKNPLFYKISYKTLIGANFLRIRLDKIDGLIRVL